MREGSVGIGWKRVGMLACVIAWIAGITTTGCARLPYTTKTVHEDERIVVNVQREVGPQTYSHPIQLTSTEVVALLRGFSVRETTAPAPALVRRRTSTEATVPPWTNLKLSHLTLQMRSSSWGRTNVRISRSAGREITLDTAVIPWRDGWRSVIPICT